MASLFEDAPLYSLPPPLPVHNNENKDNSRSFNGSNPVDFFNGDDELSQVVDPGMGRVNKLQDDIDHDEHASDDDFGYLRTRKNEIPLWTSRDRNLAMFASQRLLDASQGHYIDRGMNDDGLGGGALASACVGLPTCVVQDVPSLERHGHNESPFLSNDPDADNSLYPHPCSALKSSSVFLPLEKRTPHTAVLCVEPALICPSLERGTKHLPFSDDEKALDWDDSADTSVEDEDNIVQREESVDSPICSDEVTEVREVTPALSVIHSERTSNGSSAPLTPKGKLRREPKKKPEGNSGKLLSAEFMLKRFDFQPLRSEDDTWACPFLPITLNGRRAVECRQYFDQTSIGMHIRVHVKENRSTPLRCPLQEEDGCCWSVTDEKVANAMAKLEKNPKVNVNSELTRHIMDKHLKARPHLCPCGKVVDRPNKDQIYRHLTTDKHTDELDKKREADPSIPDYPHVNDPRLVEEQKEMEKETETETETKRKRKSRGGYEKEEGAETKRPRL